MLSLLSETWSNSPSFSLPSAPKAQSPTSLHVWATPSPTSTFPRRHLFLKHFSYEDHPPWGSIIVLWKNYYHQLCVAKRCFSSLSSSVIFTVIHFFITLALLWTYVLEALLLLTVNWLRNEAIWLFFKSNSMFQVSPIREGLHSCRACCGVSRIASTSIL